MKNILKGLKFFNLKEYLFSLQFFILFSIIIFVFGIILGGYFAKIFKVESEEYLDVLRKNLEFFSGLNKPAQFFLILLNNSLVAFFTILLGLFFGFVPFFILIGNGELFGMLYFFLKGNPTLFLKSLLPHGIIELPVIIISTSIGLKLGKLAFSKLLRKKPEIKKELSISIEFFLKVIFPLLILASFFEVFITPLFLK